jgi:hypothetical protein
MHDTQPQLLCTYRSAEARPLSLMISIPKTNPNNAAVPSSFFLPSNLGVFQTPTLFKLGRTGIIILEYGAGAARNYVFADLKPGTFAIPPSEFCQVSILAYYPSAQEDGAFDVMAQLDVFGTLFEGQHKHAARFTSTLIARVQAGKTFAYEIPAFARWVDFQGGHVETSQGGPLTSAKVRFMEEASQTDPAWGVFSRGVGAGRYIVRDEANGVFPDPLPVELSAPGSVGNHFRVWNDSAGPAVVAVKFFLEL